MIKILDQDIDMLQRAIAHKRLQQQTLRHWIEEDKEHAAQASDPHP